MLIPGLRLNLDDSAVPWRPTRHPGVHWIPIEPLVGGSSGHGADSVVLIRMDPGCGYPAHQHVGPEAVLVLQGGYRDEGGIHPSGSFLRYPAGSQHVPMALGEKSQPIGPGNPACILFAIAHGGVEILA